MFSSILNESPWEYSSSYVWPTVQRTGTNNKMHTYGTLYITVNKCLTMADGEGREMLIKNLNTFTWKREIRPRAETAGKPGMRNSYMKARVCGLTLKKQQYHHQKRLDERRFFIILTVVQIVYNNRDIWMFCNCAHSVLWRDEKRKRMEVSKPGRLFRANTWTSTQPNSLPASRPTNETQTWQVSSVRRRQGETDRQTDEEEGGI